jgi:hypothetical protein
MNGATVSWVAGPTGLTGPLPDETGHVAPELEGTWSGRRSEAGTVPEH